MKKHRPRGTGSWEASPRFLPSPASSPAADDAGRVLSPLRCRSVSDAPRKLRPSAPALWPSSRKPGTLADHLGNDRLIDLVERKAGDRPASATPAASPQSIIRQRSCSEFGRFDDKEEKEKGRRFSRLDDRDEKNKGRRFGRLDDKEEKEKGRRFGRLDDKEEKEKGRRFGRLDDKEEKEKGRGSKENRPIGGSMRYIGKIRFPRSPKPGSPPSPSSGATLTLTPGRISVDENALFLRQKSDFGLDYASSESDRSDTKIPTPRIPKSEAAKTIDRARSMLAYGSASTQWALSPGRRSESPPTAAAAEGRAAGMGRSFSNLRPPSPGKGRKVGNFISMGLDLFHFRRRSFSRSTAGGGGCSSPTLSSSSHSSLVVGSPSAGGAGARGEAGHQFRVMHNRLIQWRYVNARSDAVNGIRMATSEVRGFGARRWTGIHRLSSRSILNRSFPYQTPGGISFCAT